MTSNGMGPAMPRLGNVQISLNREDAARSAVTGRRSHKAPRRPSPSQEARPWARRWQVTDSAHFVEGFSELAVVQGVVQAAVLQQISVVAVFHDASGVHHDDRVGISDRR